MESNNDNARDSDALVAAFVRLLEAERKEQESEVAIRAVKDAHAPIIRAAQQEQQDAWGDIARLMAATGEYEVILPDEHHDYKIAWSTPPEIVDVWDANAVPDEWCKVERSPKKKELLVHLKALRDQGDAMPNWATLTRNPPKLQYSLIKKGAS